MTEFYVEKYSAKTVYRFKEPEPKKNKAPWLIKFSKPKSNIKESLPLNKFKELKGWI